MEANKSELTIFNSECNSYYPFETLKDNIVEDFDESKNVNLT